MSISEGITIGNACNRDGEECSGICQSRGERFPAADSITEKTTSGLHQMESASCIFRAGREPARSQVLVASGDEDFDERLVIMKQQRKALEKNFEWLAN